MIRTWILGTRRVYNYHHHHRRRHQHHHIIIIIIIIDIKRQRLKPVPRVRSPQYKRSHLNEHKIALISYLANDGKITAEFIHRKNRREINNSDLLSSERWKDNSRVYRENRREINNSDLLSSERWKDNSRVYTENREKSIGWTVATELLSLRCSVENHARQMTADPNQI